MGKKKDNSSRIRAVIPTDPCVERVKPLSIAPYHSDPPVHAQK